MPYVDDQAGNELSLLLSQGAEAIDQLWQQRRANGWSMPGHPGERQDDALANRLEQAAGTMWRDPKGPAERAAYRNSLPTRSDNPNRRSDVILDGQFAKDLIKALTACGLVVENSDGFCADLRRAKAGTGLNPADDPEYIESENIAATYRGVIERLNRAIDAICRAATGQRR